MTKLYDGTKTAEITMTEWNGHGYDPDWSADFYDVGLLPYDEERGAFIVDDVDYCLDQADDWKNGDGDFSDDEDTEDREVYYTITAD